MLRLLRCTGTRCKTGAALATVNGKSASCMPVARSMARAAARAGPLVIASDVFFELCVIEAFRAAKHEKPRSQVPGAGFFVSAFALVFT